MMPHSGIMESCRIYSPHISSRCGRIWANQISRKPAGRHLARVRFANEMRKGGVGGEAGETAEKSRGTLAR